ncbi:glycosyltransferase [Corticibacter populi]|uniref:Glycosyltransferase n=1 Tax=Corticibacter populi TaxID=1550736 RepID=A0A3M6QM97_9BURK|nr:glycosyltransferase [Corticibacter populi]RMX04177.1 glycosyltransferase [Corticibacter populi]RZS33199.1 GT2 family glycosyltransferase [Corticibacter populi]
MRLLSAAFAFPASVYYYRNFREWLRERKSNPDFYSQVLSDPDHLRRRLVRRKPVWQSLVCAGFLVARELEAGIGLSKALSSVWQTYRRSGGKAIRSQVIGHAVSGGGLDGVPPIGSTRILVSDYRLPRADVSAGERATVGILRSLVRLGYQVTFLPCDMQEHEPSRVELEALGVTVVSPRQGYRSATEFLSRQGHVFGCMYLIRVDVAEQLLPCIKRMAPQARLIFHAPDLYFLREMRQAELSQDAKALAQARHTRDRELEVMRLSHHTVVVSAAEAEVLREAEPGLSLSVFNALYVDVTDRPYVAAQRQGIFFIGGYAHAPNVNAVIWFVRQVWPLVRRQCPDARFDILGAEAPPEVIALQQEDGVHFVGYVSDLDQAFAAYRIGVAPLRYGAGIKGKVAATMGAGIPMACTTIAVEGMGIAGEVDALVADDPQSFADAVARLLRDDALCLRLSTAGRALVARRFGEEANHLAFTRLLNDAQVLDQTLYLESIELGLRAQAWRAALPHDDAAAAGDVDVSVIVPVYNQWNLTRRCLYSVLMALETCERCVEILLADDGSTDETRQAAELFPSVTVVRGASNVGFLRNCNAAARQARGRHLLFLNNDTVVFPGWLDALYDTLEADAGVAIAGSKLLYPDGLIQEAGASLFRDGTAVNLGRGFPRFDPSFCFAREVDYISGASILVRRSFWDQVGGFDERYAPAYCEDSDLAMMARAAGLRVVYQPRSEVIHFEHGSYAEQVVHKPKVLQQQNIAKLTQKWRDALDAGHLPPTSWERAAANGERTLDARALARRRAGHLNILYYSPYPSHPASHGNRSTIFQFASYFKQHGHAVHFVLLDEEGQSETVLNAMRQAWDSVDVVPACPLPVPKEGELAFDAWYVEGLGERIARWCHQYDIDMVFCSYVFQSKLLDYVPAHVLKVIDTHDKMGSRYDMLRRNGLPLEFFSCSEDDEGRYLRRADVVVARRSEEAEYFNRVMGQSRSIVIPHIEPARYLDRGYDVVRRVGLVASANTVNLALVVAFLKVLEQQCPGERGFEVHIAGQVADMVGQLPDADAALFHDRGIVLRGFVDDISSFYAEMDLLVSPVTVGTGINVKTVQAMAYGVPLLTTGFGSKGIEAATHPMHRFETLAALVEGLREVAENPRLLDELASASRQAYDAFFADNIRGFDALLSHPKLAVARETPV